MVMVSSWTGADNVVESRLGDGALVASFVIIGRQHSFLFGVRTPPTKTQDRRVRVAARYTFSETHTFMCPTWSKDGRSGIREERVVLTLSYPTGARRTLHHVSCLTNLEINNQLILNEILSMPT
jgi:hypothetical protein